jgi:hypothetical protein
MKRRIVELLTSIGIVLMVLGLLFYIAPIKLPRNDVTDLKANLGVSISSHRDKGERVESYFTVRFGNEEVEFSIKDPYGTVIYNTGTVKSRCDFAFTTEYEGVYTLNFFNSENTGKTIFLTEQVTILGGSLNLVLIGIGVLLVILGAIGFYEERLKANKKVEATTTSPPPP